MCASLSPPPTPMTKPEDVCANCSAFQWRQTEPAALRQCSRCKVLKYCSDDCQVEHWKLVHSKHCKKLAAARKDESEGKNTSSMPVNICSNHPFPLDGLKKDVYEALLICVQKIVGEMKRINHPAFSVFPNELKDLELELDRSRSFIWFRRKTGFQENPHAPCLPSSVKAYVFCREIDPLGLWPTLFLFLAKIYEHCFSNEKPEATPRIHTRRGLGGLG